MTATRQSEGRQKHSFSRRLINLPDRAPPETWINDRNSEKAGYRTLVLYIFFSFSFFFIFLAFLFSLFVNFFSPFLSFPFSHLPPLTHLHISPTLTFNQQLLIIVHQKRGPIATLTPTHARD